MYIAHTLNNRDELKYYLSNLPDKPGIYQMLDSKEKVIYVGKAKNIRKRVSSYFLGKLDDVKTMKLVSYIHKIQVIITTSEYEAFLLENRLIKKFRPRYNILFKDDKTYPYIVISQGQYPRVYSARRKSDKNERYFGPYVSLKSLNSTLSLIQKVFSVRKCDDIQFKSRTRPCLQYQIKRCSAPCVGYISPENYQEQVDLLLSFLNGGNSNVIDAIANKMESASNEQRYEDALIYRDQLSLLRTLQQEQPALISESGLLEVFAIEHVQNDYIIVVIQVVDGSVIDKKSWFVSVDDINQLEILNSILSHYYLSDEQRSIWPKQVIIPKQYPSDTKLLELISRKSKTKLSWLTHPKTGKLKFRRMAELNAKDELQQKFNSKFEIEKRVMDVIETFDLKIKDNTKLRIECFDVSHFQGESTIASCVVFQSNQFQKKYYRKYKINDITPGDDYAAMNQALTRRLEFKKESGEYIVPNIIIIDGGKGQFKEAYKVLNEKSLLDRVILLSLSKGPGRISGDELVYFDLNYKPMIFDESKPAFLLLRQLRDEAHRFAIEAQRKNFRSKKIKSILDNVVGIGAIKKRAVLNYFGGIQELRKATPDDIEQIDGIGPDLAREIWKTVQDI